MAGINIMVDQACKDIEAMIESLENSVEEERTKQRLDAIESEWWSYPHVGLRCPQARNPHRC